MKAAESYALRDEQEKYFEQMKGPLGTDRLRCWSEDGKNGSLFIYFAALILASYVKHVWKSTVLHKQLDSFSEVLDEMRPIRCIEHKGHAKHVTPFVGKQIDVCKAFDFYIPDGCQPKYASRKTREKRLGRPAVICNFAAPKNGKVHASVFRKAAASPGVLLKRVII